MRTPWSWLMALLAAVVPVTAIAEPVTLRVTLQVPATNPFLGVSVVQFKEDVETKTEKALRVEIFDRGKLYIDDQVVGAVQSGAIEIGVAGINQIARRLPAADIMEQPFLFNFEALTRAATSPDSEMRKLLDKAVLETIGVHVLWWQTAGSQVFISKGFDLAEPSRLKDKKVRAFSGTSASFATLCGGRPQVLSITKVHDFLKDGVIDAVMTVPTAVETRQLWKVADTITRTDHAGFEFLVIVNAKTWAGLGDRHRRIILKAARRAERDVRSASARLEEQAYAFARSKGMIAHALTPDQVAEWRACSSEVLDDYMSRGGELERRLLAAYGKLRTDPCCTAGPTGTFNRR